MQTVVNDEFKILFFFLGALTLGKFTFLHSYKNS